MLKKYNLACYLLLGFWLIFFDVSATSAAAAVRPHLKRTGVNLVTNPDVNGATGWGIGGDGGVYDPAVSRDEGTGSLRLATPYTGDSLPYSLINNYPLLIPVVPGKTYSYSVYAKTDAESSFFSIYYGQLDENKVGLGNGSSFVTAVSNEWQENVNFVTPGPDTHFIYLKIVRGPAVVKGSAPGVDGHIWLDNFYFGEGIGFEQPPTPKVPFEGSITRVDELGNVEIYKHGAWEPFFPICVYGNHNADYNVYSQQGFNCSMWGEYEAIRYKNAVSAFNPDGMYVGFDIAGFMIPGHVDYNNATTLAQRIAFYKNAGLMDRILWYYWDNETDHTVYNTWKNITDTIKAVDVDANGKRMHPIYALDGYPGLAKMYSKDTLTDVVGSYMGRGYTGGGSGSNNLTILKNSEQQVSPVVVGQMNMGYGEILSSAAWRGRFYQMIIAGGKGMGWWRDCVPADCHDYLVPFAQTGLYNELPKLRREIDAMMPIIREPEWTDWSFASSDATLRYGTREHNGEGYLIVLNTQDAPVTTTLSTTDLPYVPTLVADYFTNSQVTTYANSQFTITLEANATAVYKLPRPEPSVFANDSLKVANKKVTFGQAKKINTKSKTLTFKGNNSLIANGSVQLYRGGTLVQTTTTDATGAWNLKLKEKKDTTVTFYLRYLDSGGTELGTSAGYKIKIDTQKPKITNLPIFLTKAKGAKIWWEAKDNVKVTSYKISFLGKTKTTKSKAFTVPLDAPAGLHILNLKALDAVGNSVSRMVTVRVK
jgi:hypothetical protein